MKLTTRILTVATAMALLASSAQAEKKDIVDTAVGAGSFNTLVAAVKAAGLVETLKGEGPFTVFAPTDEAFAKLPEGTVESLLKPENKDKLVAILKYHVVAGKVYSGDALKAKSAPTLEGNNVSIAQKGDSVNINDSTLLTADIDATNGVIHVIDAVLLPPAKEKVGKQSVSQVSHHVPTCSVTTGTTVEYHRPRILRRMIRRGY